MASVFVTVGTTSFDELIRDVTSDEFLLIIHARGYRSLKLQIGSGTYLPPAGIYHGISIERYRTKASIRSDIISADLVIGHAGAGTCLETLGAKKPMVVVINETLMNNHQSELAEELDLLGHVFCCTCKTLCKTVKEMDLSKLKHLPPGQPQAVTDYLKRLYRA